MIALLQGFGNERIRLVQRDNDVIGAVAVQPWRRAVNANVDIGFVDDLDIDLEQLFFSGVFSSGGCLACAIILSFRVERNHAFDGLAFTTGFGAVAASASLASCSRS